VRACSTSVPPGRNRAKRAHTGGLVSSAVSAPWAAITTAFAMAPAITTALANAHDDAVHSAGIPIFPPAHHYPRPVLSPTSGPQVVTRSFLSPTSGPQVVKRNGNSPQPQRPDLVLNQMGQVCAQRVLMMYHLHSAVVCARARAELKPPAPHVSGRCPSCRPWEAPWIATCPPRIEGRRWRGWGFSSSRYLICCAVSRVARNVAT
jgi:hypothetical protein